MNDARNGGTTALAPFILGGAMALVASILGAAGALLAGPVGAAIGALVATGLGALLLPRLGASAFGPVKPPAQAAEGKPKAQAKAEPAPVIPEDRVDELTGLANENGLKAWFHEKHARLEEDSKGIVVLVANLDAFEQIARNRGKDTANSVLVEIARRVSTFSGDDGLAARIAGDEIMAVATVVPERALEWAEERAGTMAETICRPAELSTGALWIGGSVGAAVGRPSEGENVLKRAREALEKARRLGQGRYIVDAGK